MSFENYPSASCTIGGVAAKINDGSVILDTGWAPYGQADITVPIESAEFAENIKPQDKPRVILTGRTNPTGFDERERRQFNMVLRDREISHDQKTVRLMLATDEALLQTYGKLADDKAPRTHEANLRNLINSVIGQVIPGAALQAGSINADLTARWTAENLVTNPRTVTTEGYFTAHGGGAASTPLIVVDGSIPGGIDTRLKSVMTAAGTWSDIRTAPVPVAAGRIYTFSAWANQRHPAALTNNIRTVVYFRNQSGQIINTNGTSGGVETVVNTANNFSWWKRISATLVAPYGAVEAYFDVRWSETLVDSEITAGAFMVTEGVDLVTYFDGTTANDAMYTYTWQGTANASTSLRTPDIEREPGVFTWRAGESAWDFLQSLIGTTGLRLWCDEKRRWWLTNPADHTVPGRISVTAANSTRGTDRISIDGEGTNADGVIVRYQWNVLGEQREKTDVAGVAGKIFEHIINAPYPGAGVAAAILRRIKNRRRMQDVTTATDYSATPGKEISISLPGALDQVGYITRTNWLLAEGLMEVQAAALTEAEPGTWLAGYDDLTWAGTPDARTWANP